MHFQFQVSRGFSLCVSCALLGTDFAKVIHGLPGAQVELGIWGFIWAQGGQDPQEASRGHSHWPSMTPSSPRCWSPSQNKATPCTLGSEARVGSVCLAGRSRGLGPAVRQLRDPRHTRDSQEFPHETGLPDPAWHPARWPAPAGLGGPLPPSLCTEFPWACPDRPQHSAWLPGRLARMMAF